jgi:multidrug efflux pump subunit AcrA (membrane-fusion protein)
VAEGELYPIRLALDDDEGFPHEGSINFAETRVDPQTGALKLRGIFSAQSLKRELVPGFSARVRVPGAEPFPAIVIPDRAINTDQDRKFVYVVNAENKVEYRVVKLGILVSVFGKEVRVISDGLTTSDRIIVNGMQSVRQGVTVTPRLVNLLTEVPMDEASAKK